MERAAHRRLYRRPDRTPSCASRGPLELVREMGHADRMTERNTWPRNRSTLPGGGLSTLPGGGLSTLPGDGASTLPGGGLSTLPGGGLSTLPGGGLSTLPGGGMSTLPGGGLSTLPGGGLSTLPGGGLSSLPGGGLYDGADPNPYRSNQPPMTHFIPYLRHQGLNDVADLLARAHGLNL